MNRNGKHMKLEVARLTEAQRCEINAKLSKPNAPSKHASGGSMKSVKAPSGKFGTIRRTYCNEIQPTETFAEFESATDFKGFEALHIMSSTLTTNCFAPMFKRMLDRCMMNCDNHLRRLTN